MTTRLSGPMPPWCSICDELESNHIGGKCLFAPSTFVPYPEEAMEWLVDALIKRSFSPDELENTYVLCAWFESYPKNPDYPMIVVAYDYLIGDWYENRSHPRQFAFVIEAFTRRTNFRDPECQEPWIMDCFRVQT